MHTIYTGPPGVGKSHAARAQARSIATGRGYTVAQARDLGAQGIAEWLLHRDRTGGEVLLLDELHQLSTQAQEVLLPAIDGRELAIAGVKLAIKPFTLIGTSWRAVIEPLARRCQMVEVTRWPVEQLADLLMAGGLSREVAEVTAGRSRGTPAEAIRLAGIVRGSADRAAAADMLTAAGVYPGGLHDADRRILQTLAMDRRVGLTRLAHYTGLTESEVEQRECFLVWAGLMNKDLNGRWLASKGRAA